MIGSRLASGPSWGYILSSSWFLVCLLRVETICLPSLRVLRESLLITVQVRCPLEFWERNPVGNVHTFLLSIRYLIVEWYDNKIYVYSTLVANTKEFPNIVELFAAIPAENSCCYSLAPVHSKSVIFNFSCSSGHVIESHCDLN